MKSRSPVGIPASFIAGYIRDIPVIICSITRFLLHLHIICNDNTNQQTKTMKRFTFFLLFALFAKFGVWANSEYSTLVVETKSGDTFEISLREKPQVKMGEKEISFVCGDDITGYIYDEVTKIFFKPYDPTGITTVEDERVIRIVYVNQSEVVVSGVESTDMVNLYGLDGRRIAANPAVNDGVLTLSLEQLTAGTYILNIGNKQSFKLLKR